MHPDQHQKASLALFCKVIDNYGDIGICWRLARQLELEHNIAVTLWVDDLHCFQRLCKEVAVDKETQQINGITVRHWRNQTDVFTSSDVADIVIEFFACDIPPSYIAAMAGRFPHPVWLNLEGLSAEEWVEGCHTLPSPHPSFPLTKYFFFPGFTHKTGGLLLESSLLQQRQAFLQNQHGIASFLGAFGVTSTEMTSTKVSLFCYPHAPLAELFEAWKSADAADTSTTCLVPEGVASEAVETFLGCAANVGNSATRGALTVRVLPFLSQSDYDKLLWACDLNFVRGEDSFVRAQWAGRPFIWHIYPQEKDLHHIKLDAFLQRYTAKTDSLVAFSLAWNRVRNKPGDLAEIWKIFSTEMPKIDNMSMDWQHQVIKNGDLASNIMKFAQTIR